MGGVNIKHIVCCNENRLEINSTTMIWGDFYQLFLKKERNLEWRGGGGERGGYIFEKVSSY